MHQVLLSYSQLYFHTTSTTSLRQHPCNQNVPFVFLFLQWKIQCTIKFFIQKIVLHESTKNFPLKECTSTRLSSSLKNLNYILHKSMQKSLLYVEFKFVWDFKHLIMFSLYVLKSFDFISVQLSKIKLLLNILLSISVC